MYSKPNWTALLAFRLRQLAAAFDFWRPPPLTPLDDVAASRKMQSTHFKQNVKNEVKRGADTGRTPKWSHCLRLKGSCVKLSKPNK